MMLGDAVSQTNISGLDGAEPVGNSIEEIFELELSDTSTSIRYVRTDVDSPCPTYEITNTNKTTSSPPSTGDINEPLDVKKNGKGQEIKRGRSLRREPRYPNPLARAESGWRESESAIEVDIQPIGKRHLNRSGTFFENPNDPCAALDDSLLEPCPHISICNSVSEILDTSTSATHLPETLTRNSSWILAEGSSDQVTLISPSAAIITDYIECKKLAPEPLAPYEKSLQPLPDTEKYEYLASDEFWSLPPRKGSKLLSLLASKLPTEVLQNIFYNLPPADFNAARHSCRSWYISSLNKTLLLTMLGRGGFSSSVSPSMTEEHVSLAKLKTNMEWLLSKRLARECALGPDWTGNGICSTEGINFEGLKKPGLVHTSTVDFTEVSVHCTASNCVETLFTISNCGKFLIAASGCLVYIYELNRSHKNPGDGQSGALRPVTSIMCPRRVLACSMDTSSHRYAIAVLMDGRMGLVCDIKTSSLSISESAYGHGKKPNITSTDGDGFMRVETGPRSVYRNLCSDDDLPRSVALCPQRRCVAFGCSSGIELHWVDALTGQDLNRWFPLTAPSDFLFFLPPRRNVDSAKKLRLISSAARPNERPAIADKVFGQRSRSSPFWENTGWEISHLETKEENSLGAMIRMRDNHHSARVSGRMECSDHYRAVPLSDGNHILFTDPATGLLCLGSDAPIGGPTKLLRKIWFQGPEGSSSPTAYASGSDLTWGVRVVAGFGAGLQQTIWLFSVPRDIFTANQTVQSTYSSTPLPRFTATEHATSTEWVSWWTDDDFQDYPKHVHEPASRILPRGVRPVRVRGQLIGTCNGLVDLAVDSGSDMSVWALSKEGIAIVWSIDDGRQHILHKHFIMRDGTVRATDLDDDVEMSDAPPITPDVFRTPLPVFQETFDGSSSFVYPTRAERRYPSRWHQQFSEHDFEGDVLMEDRPDYPSEEVFSDETVIQHLKAYKREVSERRSVRDFVEELSGVARVEVEIR